MSSHVEIEAAPPEISAEDRVSWWEYGQAYDLLCEANPHYADNLSRFSAWFEGLNLNASNSVCEIGAGTGNYLAEAMRLNPNPAFCHWDWNSVMNEQAEAKYRSLDVSPEIISADIQSFPGDLKNLDVAIAVNSLYTFPHPRLVIDSVFRSLKPGGAFFTIDLGRPLETFGWARDLIMYNIKHRGFAATMKLTYKLRSAIAQNRKIDESQETGTYWEHSTEQFGATLEAAGFEVERLEICYRDKCDLAIARKPR